MGQLIMLEAPGCSKHKCTPRIDIHNQRRYNLNSITFPSITALRLSKPYGRHRVRPDVLLAGNPHEAHTIPAQLKADTLCERANFNAYKKPMDLVMSSCLSSLISKVWQIPDGMTTSKFLPTTFAPEKYSVASTCILRVPNQGTYFFKRSGTPKLPSANNGRGTTILFFIFFVLVDVLLCFTMSQFWKSTCHDDVARSIVFCPR